MVGLLAPLLRRFGRVAAIALIVGAGTIVIASLGNYLFADPRWGAAAIESNRKFDRLNLACELSGVMLALVSLRGSRAAFWGAWGIHLGLVVWYGVIFVWLKFFWHW